MPILKLHLENVGPFDALELDFTKPDGAAHLGPHILTGVNGSGKTTVLKAIAACLEERGAGFDRDQWMQFLDDQRRPKAKLTTLDIDGHEYTTNRSYSDPPFREPVANIGCIGSYRPTPFLKRIEETGVGNIEEAVTGWLSFERRAGNDHIQQFWVAALSRAALASAYGGSRENPGRSAESLQNAIQKILGPEFRASLNLAGPFPLPSLRFYDTELNFSQLASGFNATLAWMVDFLLRQEYHVWRPPELANSRPGLLLIDEIETHLHPQWQRQILNGVRAAFPDTQIVVTTHSPFVVSSCDGARLHQFKLSQGRSSLVESCDAPDSASLMANVMDVFGIESEFGPSVEKSLSRWSELKRKQAAQTITRDELTEFRALAAELSSQGEELALIVREPAPVREDLVSALEEAVAKQS